MSRVRARYLNAIFSCKVSLDRLSCALPCGRPPIRRQAGGRPGRHGVAGQRHVVLCRRPASRRAGVPEIQTRGTPSGQGRPSRARLLFWLALVTIGLAAILANFTLRQSSPSRVEFSGDALLITSRERLAICIKPVAGALVDTAHARSIVESVLQELGQSSRWQQTAYTKAVPVVETVCNERPSVLDPNVTVTEGVDISIRQREDPPMSQALSKYRVIIFVMPENMMERYFVGLTERRQAILRREAEEVYCEGHVCFEVTTGLYLTPIEIIDRPLVYTALEVTLGLADVTDRLTPSAKGTLSIPVIEKPVRHGR